MRDRVQDAATIAAVAGRTGQAVYSAMCKVTTMGVGGCATAAAAAAREAVTQALEDLNSEWPAQTAAVRSRAKAIAARTSAVAWTNRADRMSFIAFNQPPCQDTKYAQDEARRIRLIANVAEDAARSAADLAERDERHAADVKANEDNARAELRRVQAEIADRADTVGDDPTDFDGFHNNWGAAQKAEGGAK